MKIHEGWSFDLGHTDHHALNTAPDPEKLHRRSIVTAATVLAHGLDPTRTAS
jgi:tryptophanyl-tRNA synthetase